MGSPEKGIIEASVAGPPVKYGRQGKGIRNANRVQSHHSETPLSSK